MNIRQLQIFSSVATNESFSRAAEQLHMAQSAVSIAVRKLEDQLDLKLFIRADRKIRLTAEGEALLVHADRLLTQFQVARQEMANLRGLEKGSVRFSTSAMLGGYFFPPLISAFRLQYPGVKVEVVNEGTRGVQHLLDEGQIDMGVVNLDEVGPEMEVCPLLRDEVVACVAKSHSLAKKRSVTMKQFLQQPLVLYRENYFLRKLIERRSDELDQPINISLETDVLGMIMALVRAGDGATISLRVAAEQEPGLVAVPFSRPVYLPLGMGWRRDSYLSLANRAFLDFLQTRLNE